MTQLPFAWGGPVATACLRVAPEDFVVEERLPFELEGQGEHHYLYIEKRSANTEYVAKAVARAAGVAPREVSYAGLKDKHAVARQWFSVRLPGYNDTDWSTTLNDQFKVRSHQRHRAKLRRGAVAANHFRISLREVDGDTAQLESRLRAIREEGFPNYFGEQRFGHDGYNLQLARDYFAGKLNKLSRFKRSMALSAARAYIFNAVLAERIDQRNWNRPLQGDVMFLQGSKRFFVADFNDDTIAQRVRDQDIHPSGPLWGRGALQSQSACAELEEKIANRCETYAQGLEQAGLEQDRRALRVLANDLSWQWPQEKTLVLSFSLGPGAYATSLLRELVRWNGCGELRRSV